jgi:hypothetical protein
MVQPALAGQWFVRIRAERSCSAFGRSKSRRWSVERFAATVGWDVTVIDGIIGDKCLALYRSANVKLVQ